MVLKHWVCFFIINKFTIRWVFRNEKDQKFMDFGACDFAGFQMLRGRGVGKMSIDSIKAK